MKKIMTITTNGSSSQSLITDKYKDKLSSETLVQCKNYSKFYFKNSSGFQTKEQIEHLKRTIKKEAEKVAQLEENNKDNLAHYLEDLILCHGNYEFLIPYHLLKQNNIENENILNYEQNCNLGILGNINEIIEG